MNGDASRFRETIVETGLALWKAIGASLVQKLGELSVPVGTTIRLVPQGGLGLLPFHLAGPSVEEGAEPLLERFGFAYAVEFASRTEALLLDQAEALFVTDPGQDLPFAEFESAAVARRLDKRKTRLLLQQQATAASVRRQSEGANLLHFACHGQFEWGDTLASGLELANGGRLTLKEIAGDWQLAARTLIVLSACESGMAEFGRAPDASLGLPAAFLAAGATWVLATLWQVNDLASALLVDRFYHELSDGETEPSQAVRKAQLWLRGALGSEIGALLESWRNLGVSDVAEAHLHRALALTRRNPERCHFAHPFFWAGYVIVS